MSLDISIKVDPGASAAQADKVTGALHKAEDQGKAAQKAFDNLTGTFKRMADAMANDAKRTGEALNQAGRAFDGLTAAIAREQQMLEKIHGPMRQLQQDLQVLDKLQRDGKISAEEHAKALLKSGQAAGVTRGAAGGTGSGAGGLGAIAKGVNSLNLKQGAQAASQAFELLNAKLHLTETTLGNAAGSAVKFGALGMQIGGPWGAAIGGVTGAVVGLGDALADWIDGGAHAKRMKAMETETKANEELANSYREITARIKEQYEEASKRDTEAAKGRQVAITGAGSQMADSQAAANEKVRQLRTALFNETRFGVQDAGNMTAAQQMQLAVAKEKIGTTQTEILLARQVRDATIEQKHASEVYGKTVADLRIADAHRLDQQINLKKALDAGAVSLKEYNREMAKLGGQDFDVAVAKATMSLTEPVENAKRDLKALDHAWKTAVDKTGGSMALYRSQRKALIETITGTQITDYYTEMLKQIRQPEKDWTGRLHAIDALLDKGRISVEQYTVALKGLAAAYAGGDIISILEGPGAKRFGQLDTEAKAFERYQAEIARGVAEDVDPAAAPRVSRMGMMGVAAEFSATSQDALQREREMAKARTAAALAGRESVESAKKLEEQLVKIDDLMAGQLISSASEFSSILVDAANGADVSWSGFFSGMLQQFEKAIAQALILQAITGSVTGAAGANGKFGGLLGLIPGFANGGQFQVPYTAANGNDWMVGGHGGADSKRVALNVTPGELVSVRTPNQQAAQARQMGGGATTVHNHVHFDRRDLLSAVNTKDGQQAILNVIRLNPDIMKSLGRG
jgi:hypothetical protein